MKKIPHKIILGTLFIVMLLLYVFNPLRNINYLFYLIFPLYPLVATICATKSYGIKNKHGKAMLLFAIGTGLIFLGESTSFIYKYLLDVKTFPAVYDIFYSLGTIFLFAAVIKEVQNYKVSFSVILKIIIYVSLVLIVIATIIFINNAEYTLLQNIFNIYYRISQILILYCAVLILIILKEFKGGKMFKPWLYIAIGMAGNTLGGILLALNLENYKNGVPLSVLYVDTVWAIGYIFIGYGFYSIYSVLSDIKDSLNIKRKVIKLLKNK